MPRQIAFPSSSSSGVSKTPPGVIDRETGAIRLYWWQPEPDPRPFDSYCLPDSNFGDALSPYIVSRLSGREVIHQERSPKLLALGSLFFAAGQNDTVWGSGLLAAHPLTAQNMPWRTTLDIRAVRGPMTARTLKESQIFSPPVYGDPALLLPRLCPATPVPKRRWGLIPHLDEAHLYAASYRDQIIHPRWPWEKVVESILQCEWVVSSSLHGIIVAEAYGVPAVWLAAARPDLPHRGIFKYHDYYLSTGRRPPAPAIRVDDAIHTPPAPVTLKFDPIPLLNAFPVPLGD